MNCTLHKILFGWSNQREYDERGRRRRGSYRVLVGKPEEKRPLERPRPK
jgi:hypothetical protein